MSYPRYYCPECNIVSKCIGYRFEEGVPLLNTSMGLHQVYIYECENGHVFEYDPQRELPPLIRVQEKVSE